MFNKKISKMFKKKFATLSIRFRGLFSENIKITYFIKAMTEFSSRIHCFFMNSNHYKYVTNGFH